MPPRDVTLAIETSNPGAPVASDAPDAPGVCLLIDEEARAFSAIAPAQRHDDALLPAIASVCDEAGVTARELTRVGVSVGPGGYTSIRIAVSVAKTIGEATGAACVPVPTAHALVRGTPAGARTLVALAWKREDAWVQAFDDGVPEDDGRLVPIGQLGAHASDRLLIAEARLMELIDHAGAHAPPVFSARAVGLLARERAPVDPSELLPLYPREPEAVRKWRALGK